MFLIIQKEVSIVSTLFYAFAPAYAISAVFQFGYSTLQFASPQIVNALISFVSSDEPNWKGYFYTALICAVTLINTLLNSQTFYWEYAVGLRVKTALISAIYRKSVKLSSTGKSPIRLFLSLLIIENSSIYFFTPNKKNSPQKYRAIGNDRW